MCPPHDLPRPRDDLRLSSAVLQHISEGVTLVRTSDSVIVFANPQFEQMLGYGPGELLGEHVAIVNGSTDKTPAETAEAILGALHAHGRWEGEICNRRKDGSVLWCYATVSAFTHPDIGPVWVSVHRDITERKRLQEELLHTKTFLDSIVENIPDMVFVKDAKQLNFVLFNRAGEELLGYRRADLIGKNDYDFFPKDEADFFTQNDRAVLSSGALLEIPEEPIQTAERGLRLLHTKKIPILDDNGAPAYLLGISEDITDRQRAERLRQQLERDTAAINNILRALNTHVDVRAAFPAICAGLRALAQCAGVSLTLFDERREWLSLVAADGAWADGFGSDVRLPARDLPATAAALAGEPHVVRDLATELQFPIVQAAHAMGLRSTVHIPLRSGSSVVGILNMSWREVGGCETAEMGTLLQVANAVAIALEKWRLFEQLRTARERLEVLSRRLMEVQETERRHLARELHDEIGQHLTGISLLLADLKRRSPEGSRGRLDDVHGVVGELIARVRELSLDLRPAILDDFGLLPALLWLFERVQRQVRIEIDFRHQGLNRRFPPAVETAAYRIVQEALTNIARHADVHVAQVRASAADDRLSVRIADEGKGFDAVTELATGTASGLSGMRERAALVGGRLNIESRPGAGTRVEAEFDGC